MPREFEVKILNINVPSMREKLKTIGSNQVHLSKIYNRIQFERCKDDNDDSKNSGFVRIRKEAEKITMTTKIFSDKKFPEEHEVSIVEPYDKGIKFLQSIGLKKVSEQETMREKWKHPLAHEITFDIVPGLPIYMEIDCTSEDKLNELITLLELDKKYMRYGSFDKLFTEYYDIPNKDIIKDTPELSFKKIEKEITPEKNKELFEKIAKWNEDLREEDMDELYEKYNKDIIPLLDPNWNGEGGKYQKIKFKMKKTTKNRNNTNNENNENNEKRKRNTKPKTKKRNYK